MSLRESHGDHISWGLGRFLVVGFRMDDTVSLVSTQYIGNDC